MQWELKFFAIYLSFLVIGGWGLLKVTPWIASHVHLAWML